MKKILLVFLLLSSFIRSQIISEDLIRTHLVTLSSDEMQGRKAGTSGIEKAASYIESEFERIGLSKFNETESYRQNFRAQGLELFNDLIMMPCYKWNRSVVVPEGHPLTKQKEITLESLGNYPLVTYVFWATGRSKLDEAFKKIDVTTDDALIDIFAAVREASKRTI